MRYFGDKNNNSCDKKHGFREKALFLPLLLTELMMKKLVLSLSLLACLVGFNACSTDVDLYADYKDIPVIYGLIDASKDVNYVRINRAFSGSSENHVNATEVALIADSLNYPGKLDAKILEYRSTHGNAYTFTNRVIELDTMTIHDKDTGIFYAPDQKVYYTNELFRTNSGSTKYKYKLMVCKDNDTITAETGVVGGGDFRVLGDQVSFIAGSTKTGEISFTPGENATFYEVKMVFNYREEHNGNIVDKQVKWNLGSKSEEELISENNSKVDIFSFSFIQGSLFSLLETAIGGDTINVRRYFDMEPMEVTVSAGGEELYNYIQINAQAGGLSQSIPDYTNITGGYGVFSSRVMVTKLMKLSPRAQSDLYGKPWGFVQQ